MQSTGRPLPPVPRRALPAQDSGPETTGIRRISVAPIASETISPETRATETAKKISVPPPPIPAAAAAAGQAARAARMSSAAPPAPSTLPPASLPPASLPPAKAGAATPPPTPRDSGARAREAQALVDAARGGDPRAFEALVKRYRHRIFALALHMTGSPSDADDITQDAFVRAYRNIHRFEGRSEFFTWLYRIALNRALNVRRDRTRRRTQDLDDPRVTAAVAVDSGGDPHRAMELRQTYAHLVRAFDRLSPLLKTTIALTMMQGLSYPEAAVVLETTEGTIAWRIHEARKQMRAQLEVMLKDPTPVTLRAPDFERTRPRRVAEAPKVPAELAGTPPSLEMALALLAPMV
jgi:RNA polymerase sigma-70 factor (ECF subfamily)